MGFRKCVVKKRGCYKTFYSPFIVEQSIMAILHCYAREIIDEYEYFPVMLEIHTSSGDNRRTFETTTP